MKLENEIVDFESSIAPWLGKTVKIVDYYLQEELKSQDLDLTKEQRVVLKKLHDRNGINQSELAFLTLRNKSSLTRLLGKMESKKYITRKQSLEDKRVNNVFLTNCGREVFTKTRPVIKQIINIMERKISKEEKEQAIKIMKKIQFNFTSTKASL